MHKLLQVLGVRHGKTGRLRKLKSYGAVGQKVVLKDMTLHGPFLSVRLRTISCGARVSLIC